MRHCNEARWRARPRMPTAAFSENMGGRGGRASALYRPPTVSLWPVPFVRFWRCLVTVFARSCVVARPLWLLALRGCSPVHFVRFLRCLVTVFARSFVVARPLGLLALCGCSPRPATREKYSSARKRPSLSLCLGSLFVVCFVLKTQTGF